MLFENLRVKLKFPRPRTSNTVSVIQITQSVIPTAYTLLCFLPLQIYTDFFGHMAPYLHSIIESPPPFNSCIIPNRKKIKKKTLF